MNIYAFIQNLNARNLNVNIRIYMIFKKIKYSKWRKYYYV